MNNRPIGIFDSGVGGLTVVREIMKALPNERIVYLGDTARVPYGTKSNETIKRFSIENAEFLSRFKVKLIIVACNSASSIALPALKKRFRIPIIGVIKPGAKKAASITRNNRIGVIGTPTTVKSKAYDREIRFISKNIKIVSKACPLFVSLAEEGWLNGRITADIVKKYLDPLRKMKIDTLVLGCTHYPLLRGVISKVVGKNVRIVDSASSVAVEVRAILERQGKLARTKTLAHIFFVTDAVEQFVKVGERFLGKSIKSARRANHV